MISTLALMAAMMPNAQSLPAFKPAPREFRAAWVATVDNIDWPSKRDLTTEQQKRELIRILDTAKRLNMNAIIFQIRPSMDSLYKSDLEPWSEYLTNKQGKAPSPYYDPLQFAIDEAHKRGLELHTWFNPYRAKHPAAKGPLASNHVSNTKPRATKTYGRYLWMDPGEPETPAHTLEVMLDVVKRYDIDGVHIDDYFYPYEEKDAQGNAIRFPDAESYQRYRDSGGTLGLADWRRKNVDDFIEKMYREVKRAKPNVKVGISPFGIARPNLPEGIKAGIDQYDHPLYADCSKWFRLGWCDYFTPQLYWAIDSPGQPYEKLLTWWETQNLKGRHLWPGNYTSRIVPGVGTWEPKEVVDQIAVTRKNLDNPGNVHFSFKAFLENPKKLNDELMKGPYKAPALVPPSPWLGATAPAVPKATLERHQDQVYLKWDDSAKKGVRFWAVYVLEGNTWKLDDVLPTDATEVIWPKSSFPYRAAAVTAISLSNVESKPAILTAR
jgi:uncharacterized lipoprotein YddW (UPF0748 family)